MFVVDELIRRFLTDEVLKSAHDVVARAVQELGEEEVTY